MFILTAIAVLSVSIVLAKASIDEATDLPSVLRPLKESLAAALIQLSDWEPEQTFFDPLCGSGTLPLEASLQALNLAPGLMRDQFGFETWMDFDAELWQRLIAEAQAQERSSLLASILGSDHHAEIIAQAQANARQCGVGAMGHL